MEKGKLHEVCARLWINKTEFEDHQRTVHETAKDYFKKSINSEILETMKRLYDSISKRLKKNKDINEIENNKTLQELRNKSMYNLKLEKEQRKKLIKKATQNKESFERYVNMIDLMVIEMLYFLCERDLIEIDRELNEIHNDSNYPGIFSLSLGFDNSIVVLFPTENELLTVKFKYLFDGIVESLSDVPRIKYIFFNKSIESLNEDNNDPNKKDFNILDNLNYNAVNDDSIKKNLKKIIENSKYFTDYTNLIYFKVSKDFQELK